MNSRFPTTTSGRDAAAQEDVGELGSGNGRLPRNNDDEGTFARPLEPPKVDASARAELIRDLVALEEFLGHDESADVLRGRRHAVAHDPRAALRRFSHSRCQLAHVQSG